MAGPTSSFPGHANTSPPSSWPGPSSGTSPRVQRPLGARNGAHILRPWSGWKQSGGCGNTSGWSLPRNQHLVAEPPAPCARLYGRGRAAPLKKASMTGTSHRRRRRHGSFGQSQRPGAARPLPLFRMESMTGTARLRPARRLQRSPRRAHGAGPGRTHQGTADREHPADRTVLVHRQNDSGTPGR